jgi:uncharacterized membrane protein
MNNEAREILKKLVSERGEPVYRDAKLCYALLKDLGGRYEKENFLLVSALEKGIVSEIRKCSTSAAPAEIRLAQLSTRLQDLGFKTEEANWAIESWAEALGIGAKLPEILPTSVPNPDSGQVTRLQKENEDLSRAVELLSDELGRISLRSDSGEVSRLQQEVQKLNDELAGRSNSAFPTATRKKQWIAIGILTAIVGLVGWGQINSRSEKIKDLNGQVASLKIEKTKLSEKFLAKSKKIITLENSRNNLNRVIKNGSQPTGYASILVCNKLSKKQDISIALAWEEYTGKWNSEGWWQVAPGKCEQVFNFNLSKTVDEVYIYGKYYEGEVTENNFFSSADKSICVDSVDAFKFSNSERLDRCTGEKQKMVNMSQFIIYSGENTWNFTDPESP